jgi:hypothetical protein
MGHNFFGLKYSRITFTFCSQYHMIYRTRAVQMQLVVKFTKGYEFSH